MPGLESVELKDSGDGSIATLGNQGTDYGTNGTGTTGGMGEGTLSLPADQGGDASVTFDVDGDRVGVSAVEETNSLIVRSSPGAWKSIRDVIERLDVMPMQVHIEAQVVEVQLQGDLRYGVNWYFERAVTDAGLPSAVGRDTWSTLAGSILPATGNPAGLSWTFLGRNAAAVISALDAVTDLQLLQTPSVVVRNNAEATLNVGSRIPISSVTVNPATASETTYSQVQYLDTGTILKVRPRVAKDGMVFLDLVQEVSTPGAPCQRRSQRQRPHRHAQAQDRGRGAERRHRAAGGPDQRRRRARFVGLPRTEPYSRDRRPFRHAAFAAVTQRGDHPDHADHRAQSAGGA